MKIPKQIKVGTHMFEVTEQKRKHNSEFSDGTYGYTIDKDNTIVLDIEMPLSMKRVTLFHEVLHAIRFIYGGSYQPPKSTTFVEWEHYWIGLVEEPVVQVLRENPEFTQFLLSNEP